MPLLNKLMKTIVASLILFFGLLTCVNANQLAGVEATTMDRVQLVTEQIVLLKSRLAQSQNELTSLQQQHDKGLSHLLLNKSAKNFLDKAGLDISVSKSNMESINIELTDCQQTISWLEKSIQEYDNQLNVLTMFGSKIAKNQLNNAKDLREDLVYQRKLLALERSRADYLKELQGVAENISALQMDNYSQLNKALKSNSLLDVKQKQMKDELAYQQLQNHWLQQLNVLYAQMTAIDPSKNKSAYAAIERKIFYANENANFAYSQSLIARYKDQIQQMRIAILRNNSISLLNEMAEQVQVINKQVNRLDEVLQSRSKLLEKHIGYLSHKQLSDDDLKTYIQSLTDLHAQYAASESSIGQINQSLIAFRATLDQELQTELSMRQGLPTFGSRTLLDLGKETLLLPALTFQMTKGLTGQLMTAFQKTALLTWGLFALFQSMLALLFLTMHKFVTLWLNLPAVIKGKLDAKWMGLRWLDQNAMDLFLVSSMIGMMMFFNVPFQAYAFLFYLAMVWLVFKNIYVGARLCLIETTHDTSGHDVRLFHRLKWIIGVGGIVTALTVYVHQLPLVYELKNLCDRTFLLLLMMVSVLLLRSWRVLPDLILSHIDSSHPYFKKSVLFIGVLVPLLMLVNSLIGVSGYVNLIMTISWHEGLFLIVLVSYLMLRGLLTDALEQLSRLMIQYVNNGWLYTEAFLKPFDKVLRLALLMASGAALFLLYGWDEKSPIVERLTRLLHYQLLSVLGKTITPLSVIELFVVISIFYWTAKWTREFVYRSLSSRTKDMGMRNSIAILSQYGVIVLGVFLSLKVLGIDLQALKVVAATLAFGIGFGLRDLATNFVCGFLILLERPLRVGDIVSINGVEGEVTDIGSRAVIVKTWDHMEMMVPNSEIFYKTFTNWTAKDNIVRTAASIKISRHDNPHEVKVIIQDVVSAHPEVLKDPEPEVYLKQMSETLLEFELRYYINIRQAMSRTRVMSSVLMNIWDAFAIHGIKPPYPQQEIILRDSHEKVLVPKMELIAE